MLHLAIFVAPRTQWLNKHWRKTQDQVQRRAYWAILSSNSILLCNIVLGLLIEQLMLSPEGHVRNLVLVTSAQGAHLTSVCCCRLVLVITGLCVVMCPGAPTLSPEVSRVVNQTRKKLRSKCYNLMSYLCRVRKWRVRRKVAWSLTLPLTVAGQKTYHLAARQATLRLFTKALAGRW